jgi:hypothetical protein
VSTEALYQNDATLLSAEATIQFLLNKLSEVNTPFSQTLKNAVSVRISERRNSNVCNLLRYLHNKENLSDFTGVKVSKTKLQNVAVRLGRRLFPKETITQDENVNDGEDELPPEDDLKSQLQRAISEVKKEPDAADSKHPDDFKLFESQKMRSKFLENIYQALLTVKPTSVESERAFSTSGSFSTKIRSRMSDDCLSALVALKGRFRAGK